MTAPLLQGIDLVVEYPNPGQKGYFRAVDGVSLALAPGDRIGVVGESGSGKSTLGRTLAGLQSPSGGRVLLGGEAMPDTRSGDWLASRSRVQFIFQDPFSSLNPRMSVGTAIGRPYRIHTDLADHEIRELSADLLIDVGLTPGYLERYPSQLSGGERQRVAIARALAVQPDVLIADEPTSSLDVSVQFQILQLFDQIVSEHSLALVMVTHDFGVIRAITDRVAVMHLGSVVEEGPVLDVINRPHHPYTRALLSAIPSPTQRYEDRETLRAPPLSAAALPSGCTFHPRCPYAEPLCTEEVPRHLTAGISHSVACHFAEPGQPVWVHRSGTVPEQAKTQSSRHGADTRKGPPNE